MLKPYKSSALLRPELVVPYEMVEGLAELLTDIDLSLTC